MKNKFIEEKSLFKKRVTSLLLAVVLLGIIFISCQNNKTNKEELIKVFNNGQELICTNKIVSKNNGWKYHDKNKRFYRNDNTFLVNICKERN